MAVQQHKSKRTQIVTGTKYKAAKDIPVQVDIHREKYMESLEKESIEDKKTDGAGKIRIRHRHNESWES